MQRPAWSCPFPRPFVSGSSHCKYDYVLVLLLFTITEGLIPSIIGITKAMTKKPVNVIDSED